MNGLMFMHMDKFHIMMWMMLLTHKVHGGKHLNVFMQKFKPNYLINFPYQHTWMNKSKRPLRSPFHVHIKHGHKKVHFNFDIWDINDNYNKEPYMSQPQS
jgi:hypothetical protein